MWTNFFKHIDIEPSNAHVLDGNAPDLSRECEEFEAKIKDAGGVELFIGGIFELLEVCAQATNCEVAPCSAFPKFKFLVLFDEW